jgi:hypothetical protein
MQPTQTFRATVDRSGRTATGVRVPARVVEALGPERQPLVRVTINGHAYPSRVAVRGGEYRLAISAVNRTAAGVAAGDEIEVAVALDAEPREVAVPADLAEALGGRPAARRAFEALSYSRRRWYVLSIEEARRAETRRRRVAQAVRTLAA